MSDAMSTELRLREAAARYATEIQEVEEHRREVNGRLGRAMLVAEQSGLPRSEVDRIVGEWKFDFQDRAGNPQ